MWKYYVFRTVGPPLSLIPTRLGYLIAWIVGHGVYLLMPGFRRGIADNMRHVLGWETDEGTIRRATRGVLTNAAKNYIDLAKMPRMKLSDIEKMVTVHGWHHFEEALSKGKGVILVTAHLGCFDMTAQVLAAWSVKTTIIVEALEPQALMDHVTSLRESKGLMLVPARPGALRTLVRRLREGETVGVICDRDIARDGHGTMFFGEVVTMPTEPVRLAMRTGAAVVPAYNLRNDHGGYDVYLEHAIPMVPRSDDGLARNTRQVAGALEKFIRSRPDQWVVLSPVWEEGYRERCAAKSGRPVPARPMPRVD